MKIIAKKINNPMLNQEQKMQLREEFRNFDHGGEEDLSVVNYAVMMDMFAEAPVAKKAEEEAKKIARKIAKKSLLEFSDGGLTLIYKLINKKVPPDERTKIYDRLMEPDVEAEVKKLALNLVSMTKFSLMSEAVSKFVKEREDRKVTELLGTKENNGPLMNHYLKLKMSVQQNKQEKAEAISQIPEEGKTKIGGKNMEKVLEEKEQHPKGTTREWHRATKELEAPAPPPPKISLMHFVQPPPHLLSSQPPPLDAVAPWPATVTTLPCHFPQHINPRDDSLISFEVRTIAPT